MKITVDRYISDNDATISRISIDDNFECYGLEDEYREVKVMKETRIPAGTYKVGVRTEGRFHNKYTNDYPGMHKGMLHVLDVPGFEYILIHVGNYEHNTDGCLLVGTSRVETPGSMMVGSSVAAYKKFYPKVIDAALAGDLTITYIDNDLDGSESTAPAQEVASSAGAKTHNVQSGETLGSLAKKYNTSIDALKSANAGKLKKWGSVEGFNAGENITIPS
jgi:LysM repeat protein